MGTLKTGTTLRGIDKVEGLGSSDGRANACLEAFYEVVVGVSQEGFRLKFLRLRVKWAP